MKLGKAAEVIKEVFILAGFLLVGYGLYQIYPPAMYVVCGTVMFVCGIPKQGGADGSDK